MKRILFLIVMASVPAHADNLLDLLRHGVKNNPDRYASMQLTAVYSHDTGSSQINTLDLGTWRGFQPQGYQGNDRAIRGQFLLPMDEDHTLTFGGLIHSASQAFDQTANYNLGYQGNPGQSSTFRGYQLEAGLKIYFHE